MCIRDRLIQARNIDDKRWPARMLAGLIDGWKNRALTPDRCLLYTSDAADERSSVDLGGRRIIKKKKIRNKVWSIDVY